MTKRSGRGKPRPSRGSVADKTVAIDDGKRAKLADQTASDADQTSSEVDQSASDADQTAADSDEKSADSDQRASDRDQATADREHATGSSADEDAYETSRDDRESMSAQRLTNRHKRADAGRDRDATALKRDRVADTRDSQGVTRDAQLVEHVRTSDQDADLVRRLEELAAQAAADRLRAAADRERAARDRQNAARIRARLEAELERAHLDELTGAYRREMGRTALSNEIDRARRSDGRFVLAFVDVDDLKVVNDRDGHAAGDRVLQTVVEAIRARLRSFDPIIRYGGDEFVCGLSAADLAEAEYRFVEIAEAIDAGAHVGISVGFAALDPEETVDELMERADVAMLAIKAKHHSRV